MGSVSLLDKVDVLCDLFVAALENPWPGLKSRIVSQECTSYRFGHMIELVGLTGISMALIRSGHGKTEGLNNTEPRLTGSHYPRTLF